MATYIDWPSIKKAAKSASPKDQRRKLPKLWDRLGMEVESLDAAELIAESQNGFDCQPDEKAYLNAVELRDGRIMLEINVEGYALVDIKHVPETLKEEVERLLSLLSEGEVVA